MERFKDPGLYRQGRTLFTRNLKPGVSVYEEELVTVEGIEYRTFDPFRSKLAAYVAKGGRAWPFQHVGSLLYLGGGSGTTVSHVSDILPNSRIYAVERFPRPFGALLRLAERRENVYPLLVDAQMPERYGAIPGEVDFLYQDVSQRNQVEILLDNVHALLNPHGWIMLQLKTRSITQKGSPQSIVRKAERMLEDAGLELIEEVDIAPFSREHYTLLLRAE
jgi:fibrillarin-like pre-rRNA processing protein